MGGDQLSDRETERRREAALRKMLNTPPTKHAESKKPRKDKPDLSRVMALTHQIPALIDLAPIKTRVVLRKKVFGLLKHTNHLIALVSHVVTTGGAKQVRYTLEPSSFLLRLVAALRAKQYDLVTFEHEVSSLTDLPRGADRSRVKGRAGQETNEA